MYRLLKLDKVKRAPCGYLISWPTGALADSWRTPGDPSANGERKVLRLLHAADMAIGTDAYCTGTGAGPAPRLSSGESATDDGAVPCTFSISFPEPVGEGAARIPRHARQASRPKGRGAPPSLKMSQYNANGDRAGTPDVSRTGKTNPVSHGRCVSVRLFADREPLAGPAYGVDTRQTRFPAPSMRACGAPHLQENKLWAVARRPRAPSGVRRELFHHKETNHAIRHSDRPVRPRGRRVRAADGAGVERQENPRHVNAGKGTGPVARCSTAAHVNRAVERAEWLP